MTPKRTLPFDPVAEARRQWEAHGWAEAADGMALVTSVMRVQQLLLGRVDQTLRPFALTFARYEVLMLLLFRVQGLLPLSRIGARLQVQPGAVTNAIDRLAAQGLVERLAHPTDGRTTLAQITPAGRRLARRATEALNRDVFSSTGLSRSAEEKLFTVLRQIRSDAGDFVG